ncbi:MAG: ATP/GTP-binding protein [Gemmatimonadales bacterium]|nr:MAG: ATP/GTP-binding protein [Gemmatimonadales bacterium]
MRSRYGIVFIVALWVQLGCRAERPAEEPESVSVSDVGLQTPESMLHDPVADVYLVSNINGSPLEKDDNGFISRLAPTGEVLSLKWIDGASEAVTLHAPKGMALKGDTLFVADIDEVRLFHRETGSPLGSRPIAGSTFLNDVAVGPDGTVYVTDSGLRAGNQGFAPSGTDAVYRFDAAGQPVAVARDTTLGRPNGIVADDTALTVVTFGSGEIYRLDPASGTRLETLPRAPAGQLDGVVRLADGSLLVSSWECQCVYQVHAGGHYMPVVDSVPAPADIGFDTRRNRILIPLFTENRVLARRLASQQ